MLVLLYRDTSTKDKVPEDLFNFEYFYHFQLLRIIKARSIHSYPLAAINLLYGFITKIDYNNTAKIRQ